MSFLFGRARTRTVTDLPKQAREHILKLEGPNGASKVVTPGRHDPVPKTNRPSQAEELARVLSQMKVILQGTHGTTMRLLYRLWPSRISSSI